MKISKPDFSPQPKKENMKVSVIQKNIKETLLNITKPVSK